MSAGNQAFGNREIMDIKAAAIYLGVSRSHLSHILAGKVAGVPPIPHVRAGRRALIRRVVIDRWLLEQEHGVATSMAQRYDRITPNQRLRLTRRIYETQEISERQLATSQACR